MTNISVSNIFSGPSKNQHKSKMRLRQTDKSWKQLFLPRTRSRGVQIPLLGLLNPLILKDKFSSISTIFPCRSWKCWTNVYKLHHHITMLPILRGISRVMHQLEDIYSQEAAMELDQAFFFLKYYYNSSLLPQSFII